MKRSIVALSLLTLPLTGSLTACSSQTGQSGDSNTDTQVTQPPLPSESGPGTNQGGATTRPTG